MGDSFKASFAKLNGENYFTWKYKMEMYLRKEKVWIAASTVRPMVPEVGGEVTQAHVNAATTKLNEYLEKDEMARALIGLCVEDAQLSHIRNLTSAKSTWDALKTYYEQDTLTNRSALMRRICRLMLQEGGDMEQHVQQMNNLFQKLTDLGDDTLTIPGQISYFTTSLPSSYDSLIHSLDNTPIAQLTLAGVQSKVLAEYFKRKEIRTTNDSLGVGQATVLKTTTQKLKCFFLQRFAHEKRLCKIQRVAEKETE